MLVEFVADSLLTGLLVVVGGAILSFLCVLLGAWPLVELGVFDPKNRTRRGYITAEYFFTYFSFLFYCILVCLVVLFCLGTLVEVFL